jgi:hypothetical protein
MLTLPITNMEKIKEWSTIQNISHNNGFPPVIIYKLRHHIENTTKSISQTTAPPRAWVTFTFNNPTVYEKTKLFRNTGLKIAYKPPSETFRNQNITWTRLHNRAFIKYVAYPAIDVCGATWL